MQECCQMDLLVRFWDILSIQIKLHYWDSNFIGQSTATDVFNNFLGGTKNIDESKMIQVSMDGPSTNRKFSELLIAYKADQNLSNLKNIGSCSIHVLLGVFRSGAENIDWKIKGILNGAFQYLHDTRARRDDYFSITGSNQFLMCFCATLWIEDGIVVDHLLRFGAKWQNSWNFMQLEMS